MANNIVPRVAPTWKTLGLALNMKGYLLDIIEKDNEKDCEGCCNKMLDEWLNMNSDASWETLINALDRLATLQNTDEGKILKLLYS